MGKMEQESRRRAKKNELRKIILSTVALAGILSVAAVAPNSVAAMARLGIIPSKRQNEYANRSRDRLLRAGLMTKNSKGMLSLTPKGERELRMLTLDEVRPRPRRWDKKWRVLIFDIPEYRKSLRDKVRRTLESIGFIRLQDSVWIYPYDCEDFITLLKADFRIGKDILYMIVDSIENDRVFREYFGLR
ncbi:MAG: CRISPR-associated endonuclease Cas2 [Patescibacteria group bacterium]|nr:CRISPR-associated endonuclease Cas2 [Patescibacteria group bacterium]